MVKRKHDPNGAATNGSAKKAAVAQDLNVRANFRTKLFEGDVLKGYCNDYAESAPYVILNKLVFFYRVD